MTATSYPSSEGDWRGRFIYDMAASVGQLNQTNLLLWAPLGPLPADVNSVLSAEDAAWLERLLKQGGIAHLLRQQPFKGGVYALSLLWRLRRVYLQAVDSGNPTVAHVNWIQNALPLWGTKLPALITVLGSDLRLLRIPGMVSLVRSMLRGRVAILAPNAEWMVPALSQYFGDLAEIRPIPFGVHPRWFAIARKLEACSCSDWLVVSRITKAKLGHLFAWGKGFFGGSRRLHLLGPMQEQIDLPEWVEYHGPTNPDSLAHDWFPRVAGVLSLSIHDEGRPQVMIEAMAAGLPVIATDLAAHCDLLLDGKTGFLVGDQKRLGQVLAQLDDPLQNFNMGEAARRWATVNVGTWDDCAHRYGNAYKDLLGRM